MATTTLYCLNLAESRFYVGQTKCPAARYRQHKHGKGSAWTIRYPMVSVRYEQQVPANVAGLHEDMHVLCLMREYGPDAVRGGKYMRPLLPDRQVAEIQESMRHNDGLCVRCGSDAHWVAACPRDPPEGCCDRADESDLPPPRAPWWCSIL